MNKYYLDDSSQYQEEDDIDALNEETFGPGIRDDWKHEEDEEEEPASNQFHVNSGQMGNLSHEHQPFQVDLSSFASTKFTDLSPDFFKQNISNLTLEDDDLFIYQDFLNFQNESLSQQTKPSASKSKKSIDLKTLKPPSPSILPFDDPFSSSVWRPLSPELNNQSQLNKTQTKQAKPPPPPVVDFGNLNLSDEFKSLKSDLHKSSVIRLEDLEAQFQTQKPIKSSNDTFQNVTENKFLSNTRLEKIPNSEEPYAEFEKFVQTKPPATKVVPPPPGMGPNLSGVRAEQQRMTAQNENMMQAQMMMMANARMANARMAGMPLPLFPFQPIQPPMQYPMPYAMRMFMNPPMEQQRNQRKLITPAQAQRSYQQNSNYANSRNAEDRFAGFMTPKEKEWLIKIFRSQSKVSDPNVEDYYEVRFNLKKRLMQKLTELFQKNGDKNIDVEAFIAAESMIVLPEVNKSEEEKIKYIQFDDSLGKIQVLNTRCPRKLLDLDDSVKMKKLDGHGALLLKIERLYDNLLNVEDEDKRMPILPKQEVQTHQDIRKLMCDQLFSGLIRQVPNASESEGTYFKLINRSMPTLKRITVELDEEILKINKGLILVYRSLFQLTDEDQFVVILSSLLKGSYFKKYVLEAQVANKVSYDSLIIKSINNLKLAKSLVYIASSLDDVGIFTNNKVSSVLFARTCLIKLAYIRSSEFSYWMRSFNSTSKVLISSLFSIFGKSHRFR